MADAITNFLRIEECSAGIQPLKYVVDAGVIRGVQLFNHERSQDSVIQPCCCRSVLPLQVGVRLSQIKTVALQADETECGTAAADFLPKEAFVEMSNGTQALLS